jgi:hypothetical protein
MTSETQNKVEVDAADVEVLIGLLAYANGIILGGGGAQQLEMLLSRLKRDLDAHGMSSAARPDSYTEACEAMIRRLRSALGEVPNA